MKVLYWSDAGLPGREANTVHVMKMCQGMAENQHKVYLLARKVNNNIFGKNIFEYYGVKKNFEIIFPNYPKVRGGGLVYALNGLRYAKDIYPDIVYGRSVYGCYLATVFMNVPVIYEAHDKLEKSKRFRKLLAKILQGKNFCSLVVISHRLEEYYEKEWGVPKDKIIVAPDSADPVKGELKQIEIKAIGNGKHIGYIGSLYKGRGIELIMKLAEAFQNDTFHIIGGTREEINMWKKRSGFLKNIIFYGHVSPADVPAYGGCMDILLAPYQNNVYTNKEGSSANTAEYMSPMKIFEYMSYGKPIICSNLPVIKEVLQSGRDCVLCDPDDILAWTEAIKKIFNDEKFANIIAENAQQEFLEKYTWEKRAKKVFRE